MVAMKRRRSGRIVRRRVRRYRRRVGLRRRRYSRRFMGRRRVRFGGRISTYNKRELSYVIDLSNVLTGSGSTALPGPENEWMLARFDSYKPYDSFLMMFKEFKLVKCLVAVRRRNPQSVVYNQATGGNTVTASRVQSNNIWWCPWGKYDPPVNPPRQTKSAVLLTESWVVRKVSQRVLGLNWIYAEAGGLGDKYNVELPGFTNAGDFVGANVSNIESVNSALKAGSYIFNSWRSWPYLSVDSAFKPDLTCGFFLVENKSAVSPDLLEMCVRCVFKMRGRKSLASVVDVSGSLDKTLSRVQVTRVDQLGVVPKSLEPVE